MEITRRNKSKVRKINSKSNTCISSLIVNFSENDLQPTVQIKWKKSLSDISNRTTYNNDDDDDDGLYYKNKPYVPLPYIFRMPITVDSGQVKNAIAISPPFTLHLDHTLAVIWCLFSKKTVEMPIGIVQLQWALYFLKGVYNDIGEHPKDVDLCIQIIQDELLEKYAEMVDEIDFDKISKDSSHQSVCYCYKSWSESYLSYSDLENRSSFSINYADITKSSSRVMAQENKTARELNRVYRYNNPNSTTSESALKTNSSSTNNVMGFLKKCHKEQISRIYAEMERLRGLEHLMERVDEKSAKTSKWGDKKFLP